MRSAGVSTWPNIIVQVDRPPSSCQTRWTSSHSSVSTLLTVIALRTRSTRISAPPPGRLPMPASFKPAQHVAQRQLVQLVEVPDFRGAEGVQVDRRKASSQVAQQLLVPLQLQRRMVAALQEDLIAAEGDGFLDLLVQHLARQDVGVGVGALAVEGAEIADGGADVGVVDVAVDVVGAVRLGMQPAAHGVGGAAEGGQVAAVEQGQALFG